jgi:hypothetical protein
LVIWSFAVGAASLWLLYDNARQGDQIQEQRREAVMRSCTEQNDRNQRTISELDRLLAVSPRRPGAQERRDGTVALIQALVPRRDCDKLVRETVR